MQFDKSENIHLLKSQGDHGKAQQAGEQLPDKFDTDQHSDMLEKMGVSPQDLIGKPAGGSLGGLISH